VTTRFCTLFDHRYAIRGLAMLASLEDYLGPRDEIIILAIDPETERLLQRLKRPSWRIVTIADLSDQELLTLESTRPRREFCWTCTPALSAWMVRNGGRGDIVVYLDADLMFFADPRVLIGELGDSGAILIHEHRYSPERKDWIAVSGRFNVGFVAFRVGEEARACVERWRKQTIACCENDPQKGLCGDQGYLDEWPARYPNLRVMQNIGAGVAPWNISQYELGSCKGAPTVNHAPMIFYHYHALRIVTAGSLGLVAVVPAFGYGMARQVRSALYRPYLRRLRKAARCARCAGIAPECDEVVSMPKLASGFIDGSYLVAFVDRLRPNVSVVRKTLQSLRSRVARQLATR